MARLKPQAVLVRGVLRAEPLYAVGRPRRGVAQALEFPLAVAFCDGDGAGVGGRELGGHGDFGFANGEDCGAGGNNRRVEGEAGDVARLGDGDCAGGGDAGLEGLQFGEDRFALGNFGS